jgi:four helix bundle protein
MKYELEGRTLDFSVNLITYGRGFARTDAASIAGLQLLRAGTSIGANYREANRAESGDDFIHKTALAEKEASETDYWLEICIRCGLGNRSEAEVLTKEARELLAILTTINRKAKHR